MCDPVTIGIIAIGIAGASATASYVGQKKEANRAEAENTEYVAANKAAAIDAAMLNERELSLRQSEEMLATAAQTSDLERELQDNQSTAVVSAAEAGVSGNSLDAVLADIKSKQGRNKVRLKQNETMRLDQLGRDKESVLVEANNNINTVRQTNVRQPSILTPILEVGSAALDLADRAADRRARSTRPAGNGGN